MDPFDVKITSLGAVVALALARRAQKKKNLTVSGAVAGCGVGWILVATGLRGFLLLIFYQLGSVATKYKQSLKEKRDATMADTHSARSAAQVFAVSATPVVLSLLHAFYCGKEQPVNFSHNDDARKLASSLTCAVLAHHATCLADTLASEMGILSQQTPILITQPWRQVPAGTNGGITVLGLFWSLAGGAIIGFFAAVLDFCSGLAPLNASKMIVFGALSGLVGSLADSLIGATLQSSYYDKERKLTFHANSDNLPQSATLISGMNVLTNEQVNSVSGLITALLGGWIMAPIIFGDPN